MWRAKALADRLNIGTKDEMEVSGYRPDKLKLALTVILTICTGGLLLILITWRPSIKLNLTHKRCPLQEAKRVLLKDSYRQFWEERVIEEECPSEGGTGTKKRVFFINKKLKYVWDETICAFVQLRPLEHGSTFNSFHQRDSGLSGTEAQAKKGLFGENFMKVEILSIWNLLVEQAVNPFYIFQAYTVILWCIEEYYLFSGCILGLSIISITVMVWETRTQSRALRKRITTESEVMILRDGQRNITSSKEIVPGDIILLRDGMGRMEVDAVLLEGYVVTNEAMLTGESIPITKVAIPIGNDHMFQEEEHKRHMLFSGTDILQVRGGKELPALVIKTGFYTTRGELVRSILFPKPVDFHFYSDFMKMLGIFLLLGVAAMGWSFYHFCQMMTSWKEIILTSLDVLTFVVPPILPATITAINAAAQLRLKKHGIFCLSSNYISMSGSVDIVCFDKTGTLTENDLALAGVLPCQKGDLQTPEENLSKFDPDLPLTTALATCHSLTNIDGRLVGYPLDVKIFNGIEWTLIEPEPIVNEDYGMLTPVLVQPKARGGVEPEQHEVAILRTFPFESKERRVTVVVRRRISTNFEVYVKGAPETIAAICDSRTVPGLMESVLEWYTRQGLRVVAVAGTTLPNTTTWEQIELASREKLESGVEFLGLVILQNKVKLETPSVISTLHNADLSTVMITGDNLLTAVSVARQSGLLEADQQLIVVKAQKMTSTNIAAQHLQVNYYDVDQLDGFHDERKMISVRNDNYVLAADGTTFDLIYRDQDKDLFRRLIKKGKVFARMKPEQKITVVETLQDLGHCVAMCGDGCNDCGALKVANAGISLSSSEASVAAPFTSKLEDISCVPTLIREGRAALVSLFAAFKYNASMCFGALICFLIQFGIYTMPSDGQCLIMDLVLGTIPTLVMGFVGPPSVLVPNRPTKRILSFLPAFSIISFIGLITLTYWAVLTYIKTQPWFEAFVYTGTISPPPPSYENTALVLVNFHSFNIGVLVFSHAFPYRKRIYYNYILTVYLVCSVFFCLFVTFYTEDWLVNFLNFQPFPDLYTPAMILFAVATSCLVALIWERWVLYGLLGNHLLPWIQDKCGPHSPSTKLERELKDKQDWPPLSDPPQLDDNETTDSGRPPLKAMESFNIYEEANNDDEGNMLIRKLTSRHKFRASVKYRNDNPQTAGSGPTTPLLASPIAPSPITSPDHYNSPPPDSAVYQEPYGTKENGGSIFTFNESIRHQRMKGTSGAFSTFKNKPQQRQTSADTNNAEPYEVIHLVDNNILEPTYNEGDEIYSTIPDSPPSYTEDVERGSTGNQDHIHAGQEPDVSIYEEDDESKRRLDTAQVSNIEDPPHSQSIYDVPQRPRPLHRQDETAREATNMKNLMSQLSYIDEEQNDSTC